MNVNFHTNLDLAQRDVGELNYTYANEFRQYPSQGDVVEISFDKWDHTTQKSCSFSYTLQVVRIMYNYQRKTIAIELHIPSSHGSMSIADWEKWFNRYRYNKDY